MRVCLWRVWLIKDSIAINKPCQVLFWNARKFSLLFMQTQRDAAVTCLCFLSLCPTWEVQGCFSSCILLFFFVQFEMVKKTLHEMNKIPKNHSGSLYITYTVRFVLLILTSKGFLDEFFLVNMPKSKQSM